MSYTPIPTPSKASFAELLAQQKASPEVGVTSAQQQRLAALGIQGTTTVVPMKDANGNPMFDAQGNPMYRKVFEASFIPDWYRKAVPTLEGKEPCWFEGCSELVTEYQKEVENAKKKPGGCSACKKSGILQSYLLKFRTKLPANEVNKVAQPTSPPVKVTNLDTKKVTTIPRKPIPYATIKRVIPDELKAVFSGKTPDEHKVYRSDDATISTITGPTEVS